MNYHFCEKEFSFELNNKGRRNKLVCGLISEEPVLCDITTNAEGDTETFLEGFYDNVKIFSGRQGLDVTALFWRGCRKKRVTCIAFRGN